MNPVLAKILRTFFTSLVLYYSKKLVYYIDVFFTDIFKNSQYTRCNDCDYIYRLDIANKEYDNCCPSCGVTAIKSTKIDKQGDDKYGSRGYNSAPRYPGPPRGADSRQEDRDISTVERGSYAGPK